MKSSCVFTCLLFFFQAEDGIRDYKVTGVQTCALPIWRQRAARARGCRDGVGSPPGRGVTPARVGSPRVECFGWRGYGPALLGHARLRAGATPRPGGAASVPGARLRLGIGRRLLLICVVGAPVTGGCAGRRSRVLPAVTCDVTIRAPP